MEGQNHTIVEILHRTEEKVFKDIFIFYFFNFFWFVWDVLILVKVELTDIGILNFLFVSANVEKSLFLVNLC